MKARRGIALLVSLLAFVPLFGYGGATLDFAFDAPSSEGEQFVLLHPDETGVRFHSAYRHPKRWTDLWHQYFLGTIGAGVALGDVDGDGLPDIFAVGKDSPNALYLNLGGFRFCDFTGEAGVAGGDGIGAGCSFADVDNDGDLDLYVTYTGSPNELYLNDGTGRFAEVGSQWGLALDTGSNAPSFADFDRDGDLDLYLQCNFLTAAGIPEGMPDRLLRNEGGRFVEATESSGVSGNAQGHAAVWWDYNEDGWPDLYVANDFEPADRLYRNNKDGTFTDVIGEVLPAAPYSAMGADIGDINNDGHVDLLVGEMATADHEKHQRTVATIETKTIYAPSYTVGQHMHNMLSVKIGPKQYCEVSRLVGLDATDWTWATRLADLDCDGWQDALFTNGMIRAFHDGDLGTLSEKAKTGWQRMAYFKQAPQYDERNQVYRNRGGLAFEEASREWGFDKLGVSFSAAYADLDQDGDLDVVVSNLDAGLDIYRNDVATGNRLSLRLEGKASNRFGIGAKARLYAGNTVMTRELGLTRGYLSSDEPVIHFGLGDLSLVDRIEVEWPSGAQQTVTELSVNARYRIQEMDTGFPKRERKATLFQRAKGPLGEDLVIEEALFRLYPKQTLIPEDESSLSPALGFADWNEDGAMDFALGSPNGQEPRLFVSAGEGRLEETVVDAFADDWDREVRSIQFLDANGDGKLDVFLASGGIEWEAGDPYLRDRVYLNRGDERFELASEDLFDFPALASGPSAMVDVDGDGEEELLVAGGTRVERYPDHEDNLVWRRVGNRWALDRESPFARQFRRSGNVSDLLAVDWSGDGKPDLVQCTQWGPPRLWRWEDEGLVEVDLGEGARALSGKWRSVAAGDFDRDGRMDLVLGNEGLNTRHVASIERPLTLFFPKEASTTNQYIEAHTAPGGALLPVQSRLLHEAQFPGVLGATSETIAAFARQSIDDIFPSELLARFNRAEVRESRSVALFQREAGVWEAEALPQWGQSGVAYDVLAEDFDGDGWTDILLALEPRAAQLWTNRRLDGHLILLINDGGGSFRAELPWTSGLEMDGRPRALGYVDLSGDGEAELYVAPTDGPVLVFERPTER